MARFKIAYICIISFACLYSLVQVIIKSISYLKEDTFKKSETLRTILFGAEACRILFEISIELLFVY